MGVWGGGGNPVFIIYDICCLLVKGHYKACQTCFHYSLLTCDEKTCTQTQ